MTDRCVAKWADEQCSNDSFARGLCHGHYQQSRRGVAFGPLRYFRPSHVVSEADVVVWAQTILVCSGECMLWPRGVKYSNDKQRSSMVGYPYVRVDNKQHGLHRLTAQYLLLDGEPLPDGAVVHHRCANKKCLKPEHLQITTAQANTAEWIDRRVCLERVRYLESVLRKHGIDFD